MQEVAAPQGLRCREIPEFLVNDRQADLRFRMVRVDLDRALENELRGAIVSLVASEIGEPPKQRQVARLAVDDRVEKGHAGPVLAVEDRAGTDLVNVLEIWIGHGHLSHACRIISASPAFAPG